MRSRYADWHAPACSPEPESEPDPTQELIDAPEPQPWTRLRPLFPPNGIPFTPTSRCPHHCPPCEGEGVFYDRLGRVAASCLKCRGTGEGPVPKGSDFMCVVCFQAGKDGTRALPLDVAPLPLDPPPTPED